MIDIKFFLPSTCFSQYERIVTEAEWPVNLRDVHINLSTSLLPETGNDYRFAICNCPNPSFWLHWGPNDQMFHHYYGIRAELSRQMCVSPPTDCCHDREWSDFLLWLGQWAVNPPTPTTDPVCQLCPAPLRIGAGYTTTTHTNTHREGERVRERGVYITTANAQKKDQHSQKN